MNESNLFGVLNAYWRMPPGASWLDQLTKRVTNTLEAAGTYGFARASVVPNPPLLRKKYIVPKGAGGDWLGHDNQVAVFDGINNKWMFFNATDGQLAIFSDGSGLYFDEAKKVWVSFGVSKSELENILQSYVKTSDLTNTLKTYVSKTELTTELAKYVKKAGDTMTGALTLPADPTANLQAATKQYVDNTVKNAIGSGDPSTPPSIGPELKETLKNYFDKPLPWPLPESPDGTPIAKFTVHGANPDFEDLQEAFHKMRLWVIPAESPIELTVQKGVHTATKGVVHSANQLGLRVNGTVKAVKLQSMVSNQKLTYSAAQKDNWNQGQSFDYYKSVLKLDSVEGLSVGEFLLVRSGIDTWPMVKAEGETEDQYKTRFQAWMPKSELYPAYGGHEIVSIDSASNNVTVLSFNHHPFPDISSIAPVNCVVVQSVILYAKGKDLRTGGVDALRFDNGGACGEINNVAFVGRSFPETNGNRGPYEYQEPVNFYGFLSYENTSARFGSNAVIAGFCADNLLIGGHCEFRGFTSNSWGHNIVIVHGGVGYLDAAVSHGGWLDGVCVQDGGTIKYSSLFAVGNARCGITFSQGCATAACNATVAAHNGTKITGASGVALQGSAAGVSFLGGAIGVANHTLAAHNVGFGISVNHGASATVRFAKVFKNSAYGLRALACAAVSADHGSFFQNAQGVGYYNVENNEYDVLASMGAYISLANTVNQVTDDELRSNPVLNAIGRRGAFIFGDTDYASSGQLAIATSAASNKKRDVVFWDNGLVTFGDITSRNEINYVGVGEPVKVEVKGTLASQGLVPRATGLYHLGTANFAWGDIYCKDATIHTSDWRAKDDIAVSPLGLSFINRLHPVKYKWLDYIEKIPLYRTEYETKPDGQTAVKTIHNGWREVTHSFKRPHYGLISQDVKNAIDAEGQSDCAAFIEDIDTGIQGLRYEELISPMVRAIQELAQRVQALETKLNVEPAAYVPEALPDFGLEKQTEIIRPVIETETVVDTPAGGDDE